MNHATSRRLTVWHQTVILTLTLALALALAQALTLALTLALARRFAG